MPNIILYQINKSTINQISFLNKLLESSDNKNANEQELQKEKDSKACQGWKDYIATYDAQSYAQYKANMYEAKLARYNDGIGKTVYGVDDSGNAKIPDAIKEKLLKEVQSEAMPALKSAWAAKRAGYTSNPSILTSVAEGLNPIRATAYYYHRALTVSSTEEGFELVTDVGLRVAVEWTLHIVGSAGSMFKLPTRPLTANDFLVNPSKIAGQKIEGLRRTLLKGGYVEAAYDGTSNAYKFQHPYLKSEIIVNYGGGIHCAAVQEVPVYYKITRGNAPNMPGPNKYKVINQNFKDI